MYLLGPLLLLVMSRLEPARALTGTPGAKIKLDDTVAPIDWKVFVDPETGRTRKDAAYPYFYDADTNEIIDSDDPTRMRSTQDIRQLMPTCFDRIDRDVSIFAWGNPWSIPNDTMTYFKPRGIATTDDMAATMFELMSLAETADQYEEPCLAVLALAGSIDPITNAPWFFAPTPDLELSFYPDPRAPTTPVDTAGGEVSGNFPFFRGSYKFMSKRNISRRSTNLGEIYGPDPNGLNTIQQIGAGGSMQLSAIGFYFDFPIHIVLIGGPLDPNTNRPTTVIQNAPGVAPWLNMKNGAAIHAYNIHFVGSAPGPESPYGVAPFTLKHNNNTWGRSFYFQDCYFQALATDFSWGGGVQIIGQDAIGFFGDDGTPDSGNYTIYNFKRGAMVQNFAQAGANFAITAPHETFDYMTSSLAINGGKQNPRLTAAQYLAAAGGGYTICDCQPPQFIPFASTDAYTFAFINQTVIAGGSTVNSMANVNPFYPDRVQPVGGAAYVDAFSQLSLYEPSITTHYKRGNQDGTLPGNQIPGSPQSALHNDFFVEGWMTCDSATTPSVKWPITHVFSMDAAVNRYLSGANQPCGDVDFLDPSLTTALDPRSKYLVSTIRNLPNITQQAAGVDAGLEPVPIGVGPGLPTGTLARSVIPNRTLITFDVDKKFYLPAAFATGTPLPGIIQIVNGKRTINGIDGSLVFGPANITYLSTINLGGANPNQNLAGRRRLSIAGGAGVKRRGKGSRTKSRKQAGKAKGFRKFMSKLQRRRALALAEMSERVDG